MSNEDLTNVLKEAIRAGGAIAGHKELSPGVYGAVVPDGYDFVVNDITDEVERVKAFEEKYASTPMRNKGTVLISTVDSFNRFVEREFLPDTTVCFASLVERSFMVIFNYASAGDQPGWADRKVILELEKTAEWRRWEVNNRERMTQMQLADFVEENLESIVEPSSADLVEMVRALRIKKNAQFDSVIDQNTGLQSVAFSEDIKGETVNSSLEFHGKFKIGVAPFHGSEKYGVECNLRFSVDDKRLLIFFAMINYEAALEAAFNAERDKVVEAMDKLGVPIFDQ